MITDDMEAENVYNQYITEECRFFSSPKLKTQHDYIWFLQRFNKQEVNSETFRQQK